MAKISFEAVCHVSDDVVRRNKEHSAGLGLKELGSSPVPHNLAVVGGGVSIVDNCDKIKNFDGEVWAINGAFAWCKENGIDATFYAIDPHKLVAEMCSGASRAVVADLCHPGVFQVLNGACVELAKIGKGEVLHDTTAASSAPMIASKRGHKNITFFGCESSMADRAHAYDAPNTAAPSVWVECGGAEYATIPQLIMQAEFLAELARALPEFITIVGGGFLGALVEHGDYRVTHTSRKIKEALEGLQYEPAQATQ